MQKTKKKNNEIIIIVITSYNDNTMIGRKGIFCVKTGHVHVSLPIQRHKYQINNQKSQCKLETVLTENAFSY